MDITKDKLDIPFCQLIIDNESTETPRQFIRNSEEKFGISPKDIENMPTHELHIYIEFLDELCSKELSRCR